MVTMLYPRRVLSGPGCLSALGQELQNRFAGVLIVAGSGSLRRSGVLERIEADLREAGLRIRVFEGVEPEPSVDTATMCTGALSEFRDSLRAPVAVLGIGGGSVLDVAKAAAVNEPSTVAEIFRGKSILTKECPSRQSRRRRDQAQATTNAVLTDTETGTRQYPQRQPSRSWLFSTRR